MGSPAHDAPPPPGREFVLFLALVAVVGLAIGSFVIAPLAGDAFIFVLGFIAFLAPLIGWGVQVSFGKFFWRQGDFLPVGMLFISFLCGAAIFKNVILDEYDPGFAKEYRFNWFDIAGDGANDATGAKDLDQYEYANVGVEKLAERALAQGLKLPEIYDADALVHEAEIYWDRADRPHLKSFDAKAKTAVQDYLKLPASLQQQIIIWVTKAKLAERISQEAFAAKISRLEAELQSVESTKRRARIEARLKELREVEVYAPMPMAARDGAVLEAAFDNLHASANGLFERHGEKVAGGAESYKAIADADAALLRSYVLFMIGTVSAEMPATMDEAQTAAMNAEAEAWAPPAHMAMPPNIYDKDGKLTETVTANGYATAFVAYEQALLNWRYSALDPFYSKELKVDFTQVADYMAHPVNLAKAKDPHFQAFAIGILIDNVTAIVLLMVTLLAFLIHLFSIGYMYGEIRYGRFMATINLFTAGMIGLVLSNNFLWLFVCWEIMGLCSYLLIGHYFEKKSAQEASMKAFFTTRIADTFMFLGMMMIFAYTGTFVFAGSPDASAAMEATGTFMGDVSYAGYGSFFDLLGRSEILIGGIGAFVIGLLCFLGPAGKSAQFPFHVWLPDAMEGPTPVSAMIHAACMVSAGVYLTARLFPLFTPEVLEIIAIVGGFTALAAGTIGLVQTDLKKVLAYSTISQLGYMFLGIGVGSWYPALFHMLTHAFFKALMFLGSGSVILGCHHEQEMPKMGGLWKKMPITTITFWVGNLSIIGLPFFFAAYYSKEAILTDSILLGEAGGSWLPYIFGALGAGLTTFYMCRLMWLTFHGKPRDKHLYDHVKESPWTVTVPLIIIAVGSLFVSWPIGAASNPGVNLGITHISQTELAGPEDQGVNPDGTPKRRAQAPSESNLGYVWWKPASAWSRDLLLTESGATVEPRLDRLYADKQGRPAYSNQYAWRKHDMIMVKDRAAFLHPVHGDDGHGAHGEDAHGKTEAHASNAGTSFFTSPFDSAVISTAAVVPSAKAGMSKAAHDDWNIVDGHNVHAFHEEHHSAHIMAFMVALIMLALGIGFSVFLYLGPMAGKDWVGHHGFRYRVKKTLLAAYNVDSFYFATVLRVNRWLRQFCSWFDRTFVDGFVNLVGVFGRWKARVAAKIDFWGVDGAVRGVSNATNWSGRQAQRATTGKIQDYVFLLVAGIVVLYIVIVLFR